MPRLLVPAALVFALAAGCRETTNNISRAAVRLAVVSGNDQTAGLSAALTAPLVVQATDGAGRPVANVSITWTVTGGGTLTPATGVTDVQGQASTRWTLGPAPGTQTASATSASISGAGATFIAGNGPTITGTVTIADPNPASFFSAQRAAGRPAGSAAGTVPRYTSSGLEVIFRNDVLHVAQAGAPAYRSLAVARTTAAVLRQRMTTLMHGLPVRDLRVSPAILAAHVVVADTDSVNVVMAALRADPSVASVSRDVIVSVRTGAPAPQAARFDGLAISGAPVYHPGGAPTNVPNDPYYSFQSWGANLVDLPRAWAIATGGTGFTIAVVDMGVRFDDPDVAPNYTNDGYDFVSPTTLAQLGYSVPAVFCGGGTFANVDDDGDNGPDPDPTDPDDVSYDSTGTCWQHATLGDHGLWTSGIIGAVGNDGRNVTGVDWTARIRPIRVIGITGDGIGFDVAQGILYAAGLPATGAGDSLVTAPSRSAIINLSLGGFGVDPADSAAVAAAVQAGCLVVASAGNATSDVPFYPAAYAGVVGVSAVGMDGTIASYSNAGSYVALSAPGGDFRLDDNGGDGVLGPAWNFVTGQPTLEFGYGTSAAAPYVSGAAGLLLAHEPTLTAQQLTTRLEQYASRPPNSTRSDTYGWGIVNAYNALTQQDGPPRQEYVRLLDAATGKMDTAVEVDATGRFTFTQLAPGTYRLEGGQDESGDATIGIPGRRFGWAGPAGDPTVFNADSGGAPVQTAGITIGVPTESEPNNDVTTANPLSVGGYVVGSITPPDTADFFEVLVPTSGTYTFETSGVTGSCGWGLELDTSLQLLNSAGTAIATNDNNQLASGPNCSTITTSLTAGTYYVEVQGSSASGLNAHGRYRLQVRTGT